MNATINSMAMQLLEMWGYSIQITFAGTPTGSFKLQGSDDPVPKANLVIGANGAVIYTPVYWSDIANSTFAVTAAGNVAWDVVTTAYNYVRVVYSDTSDGASTATITAANANFKGQ